MRRSREDRIEGFTCSTPHGASPDDTWTIETVLNVKEVKRAAPENKY